MKQNNQKDTMLLTLKMEEEDQKEMWPASTRWKRQKTDSSPEPPGCNIALQASQF